MSVLDEGQVEANVHAEYLDEQPVVVDAAALQPRTSSVLDELRQMREEVKAARTVDLEVPGYDGKLIVRYNAIGTKRAEVIGKAVMRERKEDRNLIGSMDTLIEACEGLYFRDDSGTHPIDPDWPTSTRFDQHLAELFGFPATTARDVVRELFPSGHAIIRANIVLSKWMSNPALDMTQEMLGE